MSASTQLYLSPFTWIQTFYDEDEDDEDGTNNLRQSTNYELLLLSVLDNQTDTRYGERERWFTYLVRWTDRRKDNDRNSDSVSERNVVSLKIYQKNELV